MSSLLLEVRGVSTLAGLNRQLEAASARFARASLPRREPEVRLAGVPIVVELVIGSPRPSEVDP